MGTIRTMLQLVSFLCFVALGQVSGHPNVWSRGPANPDAHLAVVLAVQQLNLDTLEAHFNAVSDPASPRRGKYLSFQEVGELVRNPAATQAVKAWAEAAEFELVDESSFGEYVVIRGPVRRLSTALSTTFHRYLNEVGEEHVACTDLVVPKALEPHVSGILGAIHSPLQKFGNTRAVSPIASSKDLPVPTGFYPLPGKFNGTMTPQKIKSFYNIDNDQGSPHITQDIFSTDFQVYTLTDLRAFQSHFGLNTNSTPENVRPNYPYNDTCPSCDPKQGWDVCLSKTYMCGEASLDVQYLTGVSQVTHTRVHNGLTNYGNLTQALESWILDAANRDDSTLALVHSISYGIAEDSLRDLGLVTAFNTEAMKLGARGVSSIADSGSYTAGGGFSQRFPTPAWQRRAVSGYLQSSVGKSLVAGFNASSRAYPDLTFASNNFEVVIGGILYPMMCGTSAAAPSVAGLFSLVNARRMAHGKGGVGFVNPTLYAAGSQGCCNDITEGANMCARQPPSYNECTGKCVSITYASYVECTNGCLDSRCQAGFVATEGWDAASGLGSPDFQKLLRLFGVKETSIIV